VSQSLGKGFAAMRLRRHFLNKGIFVSTFHPQHNSTAIKHRSAAGHRGLCD